MATYDEYRSAYSESGFWKIVRRIGKHVPFMRDALAMYFCLADSDTPVWVKGVILGALGYFVCPVDLIPDTIPVIGYTDDAAVIYGALNLIKANIRQEHWDKADDVFGGL